MEKINYFGMYGIGTEVMTPDGKAKITSLTNDMVGARGWKYEYGQCTLILRSLSSLTDDEKVGWYDVMRPTNRYNEKNKIKVISEYIKHDATHFTPAEFTYLLSLHIDLFQLADKGWAKIDNAKYVDNGK